MMPQRVRLQHEAAVQHPSSIIGCRVRRDPPNSTERYTRWINQLTPEQLLTQVFTSNGPTVIMPTWFCSRAWFSDVGPFDEGGQGVPEDLLFFYEHLRKGGSVIRVDQSLLLYRYHPQAATHAVLETTIWTHRVRFLEERALPHWAAFTIWNAGKQGRRLYRSLTATNQRKVVAFCDVDENKIRKGFYCHEDSQERPKPRIPILHFRAARPPFVICVKLKPLVPSILGASQASRSFVSCRQDDGAPQFHTQQMQPESRVLTTGAEPFPLCGHMWPRLGLVTQDPHHVTPANRGDSSRRRRPLLHRI
ncbi:UDP-GlcNAc:betaGal beta-1,3-N-acetylglucosaminyltransferase-like protein 1 isoform X2 [Nomascus leucogenys]|uniref:UDP-GlcNAc:betaGal beta-1,3-N-acetylglucosaminyltransferase-like protein 1 isoform X2 n=1 Tax=Nomascus leucogenys TaxID=61853 RepID=UPI00122DBF12|nr:UDP-GlcNAc:betaGal beta-1,3-N-acetylglucosaminyltransferase-like protein 1 isoform X2 [Nomascus leucogenys]